MFTPRLVQSSERATQSIRNWSALVFRYAGIWLGVLALGAGTAAFVVQATLLSDNNDRSVTHFAATAAALATYDTQSTVSAMTHTNSLAGEVRRLVLAPATQRQLQQLRNELSQALRSGDSAQITAAANGFTQQQELLLTYAVYESPSERRALAEEIRQYISDEIGYVIAAETILYNLHHGSTDPVAVLATGELLQGNIPEDRSLVRLALTGSDAAEMKMIPLTSNETPMWITPELGGVVDEDMLEISTVSVQSVADSDRTYLQFSGRAAVSSQVYLTISDFPVRVPVGFNSEQWTTHVPNVLPDGVYQAVVSLFDDFGMIIAKSEPLVFTVQDRQLAVISSVYRSSSVGTSPTATLFFMVIWLSVIMASLVLILLGYMLQTRRSELQAIKRSNL